MRRSSSFQDIGAVSSGRLTRLGKAVEDAVRRRPARMRRRRGFGGESAAAAPSSSTAAAAETAPAVNKFEGSSVGIDGPLHGRLLFLLSLPFVPLLIYAAVVLIELFSSFWRSLYVGFLLLYLMIVAAYVVSEVAIRPPWYHNSPAAELTMKDLPNYWQGKVHDPQFDMGLAFDDVAFRNEQGATLRGWYIPPPSAAADAAAAAGIVCVHGGGRDRRAWLRHSKLFHAAGWAVLLFDFGEHGTSDGARLGFTFGVREQGDVASAVRFMREKGHERIAAVGTSVGGASVIMAAARDHAVDCVVAENPVAAPDIFLTGHLQRILAAYLPDLLVRHALRPFYWLVSGIFLFRIGSLSSGDNALNAVAHVAPIPLLLMHGTMDDLVPPEHTSMLEARAKDPCEVWMAPDAWHCALYDMHPEEYADRVVGFLKRHLNSS